MPEGEPRRVDRKAPLAALLFALIIALLPYGRAQENSSATEEPTDTPEEVGSTDKDATIITTAATTVATETLTELTDSAFLEEEDHPLEFILMVSIPLILLAFLLLSVVFIMIRYKRKKTKQESSVQGSQSIFQTYELGSDNLKLPIFEEDTPSVMEIEVEELDKWMNNMNRNADSECLPTVKEEKESNHSPSDNES
ncbi:transmembrane protein 154 [Phyllostomus discolor]|uniref:Transmembrane protein 154 n=1 Tax=Phyllostomus discolor TaxID=89673 RepID=A0A833ZS01_9CHIR|nr:transmembrane protein 154 [Phyllostomus discolor]